VLCLCRPLLVVPTVVPQQSFVAVLVDDSQSMRIADVDGEPRSAWTLRTLAPGKGSLVDALSARFKLRLFRFGAAAERLESASDLGFEADRSDLANALDRVREDLGALPLSGVVLLSDGAHNAEASVTDTLLALQARNVPVFAVGLGRERHPRDVEVSRVEAPRSVLKGTSLAVEVVLAQRGYGGRSVPLHVEDSGRIIATQQVELPGGAEGAAVRVHINMADAGPRRLRFRVPAQDGEEVPENNQQDVLMEVVDRREKVLYVEGEPRFELKFLRRAVREDPNLQLVTLQRTADNKFLRLDVDDADELAGGFPKTRPELFRYRGLVLGSLEASFFTSDQLRALADFVGQRGGGLLMLGGPRSFSEGGYAPTPLADVLPVVLEPRPAGAGQEFFARLKVEPTPPGLVHAAMQIAGSEEKTRERWRALPPLSAINPVRRVKPGAVTLLTGRPEGAGDSQVVLAHQRYGRGRALALTVQDSWQWQMHADMALEDATHERLWQQILRWLVSQTPGPVSLTASKDRVAPGERVALTAEVGDDAFLAVNDARVTATVRSPSGRLTEHALDWTVERDGEYRGGFVADEKGLYEVRVTASRGPQALGGDALHVDATTLATEYFGSEMRAPLLQRLASETGGRFYTTATAGSLAEDIGYSGGGTTVLEHKDLWDMPAVFLALVLLLGTEWAWRRVRGLA
jgi:uncharacterized membrane protein